MKVYDKAISEGRGFWVLINRAHRLSRHEGHQAAVSWFQGLMEEDPDPMEYYELLGLFHKGERRYDDAIEALGAYLDHLCQGESFRFDEDHELVLKGGMVGRERNGIGRLFSVLREIAVCHHETRNFEEAFQFSTMALSASREMNRRSGHLGEAETEAGDVDCRVIRASVFTVRRELEAAEREIEAAKRRAGKTRHGGWQKSILAASDSLEKARQPVGK